MKSDGLDRLHAALAARSEHCWNRLDDTVDELLSLHDVDVAAILDHVAATARQEAPPEPPSLRLMQ
jgi:hypothetical protein